MGPSIEVTVSGVSLRKPDLRARAYGFFLLAVCNPMASRGALRAYTPAASTVAPALLARGRYSQQISTFF